MPEYSFTLNGEDVTVDTPGDPGLLYVMRDILGVRGPKYGCGVGVCKACTCHVAPGRSDQFNSYEATTTCNRPISFFEGKSVRTIEGLADADSGELHPLQQAWIDIDVAQCGFCQPGQIMAACAALDDPTNRNRDVDDIVDEIDNVCRCGSYHVIREAVKAVVDAGGTSVRRMAGADRVGTAIAVSQGMFGAGNADLAVLARADQFADALTGSALAAAGNGPLLLSGSAGLDSPTIIELRRVLRAGSTVYLLGGTSALSDDVAKAVTAAGFTPQRIGGASRQETSALVASHVSAPAMIMVASGDHYGDALVAGAAAALRGGTTLLTGAGGLHPAGQAYLDRHAGVPVFVVGQAAFDAVGAIGQTIIGDDAADLSVMVARQFGQGTRGVGLASTDSFADALAGAVHAARTNRAVLLTPGGRLAGVVRNYLADAGGDLVVYGGTAAVDGAVAREAGQVQAAV